MQGRRHHAWKNGRYLIGRKGGLGLKLRVYQRGITELEPVTLEDRKRDIKVK
jgi:hypothetical protein